MKQIEKIKSGKNFSAVSVGKMSEIIEHVLKFLPLLIVSICFIILISLKCFLLDFECKGTASFSFPQEGTFR